MFGWLRKRKASNHEDKGQIVGAIEVDDSMVDLRPGQVIFKALFDSEGRACAMVGDNTLKALVTITSPKPIVTLHFADGRTVDLDMKHFRWAPVCALDQIQADILLEVDRMAMEVGED